MTAGIDWVPLQTCFYRHEMVFCVDYGGPGHATQEPTCHVVLLDCHSVRLCLGSGSYSLTGMVILQEGVHSVEMRGNSLRIKIRGGGVCETMFFLQNMTFNMGMFRVHVGFGLIERLLFVLYLIPFHHFHFVRQVGLALYVPFSMGKQINSYNS